MNFRELINEIPNVIDLNQNYIKKNLTKTVKQIINYKEYDDEGDDVYSFPVSKSSTMYFLMRTKSKDFNDCLGAVLLKSTEEPVQAYEEIASSKYNNGKGVMYRIYKKFTDSMYPILSDKEHSLDGKDAWPKILKTSDYKIFCTEKKKFVKIELEDVWCKSGCLKYRIYLTSIK